MASKNEDFLGRIEAEQSLILQFIEDNKRHCARSDVLMNEARNKRRNMESEGQMEDG